MFFFFDLPSYAAHFLVWRYDCFWPMLPSFSAVSLPSNFAPVLSSPLPISYHLVSSHPIISYYTNKQHRLVLRVSVKQSLEYEHLFDLSMIIPPSSFAPNRMGFRKFSWFTCSRYKAYELSGTPVQSSPVPFITFSPFLVVDIPLFLSLCYLSS